MKTETSFLHYSTFPIKIAEENKPSLEKIQLRIVGEVDLQNQRFAFIDNKAIEDSTNWDASWFANYE